MKTKHHLTVALMDGGLDEDSAEELAERVWAGATAQYPSKPPPGVMTTLHVERDRVAKQILALDHVIGSWGTPTPTRVTE